MTDQNAIAARRWIAERLAWERFLVQASQPVVAATDGTDGSDLDAREAA